MSVLICLMCNPFFRGGRAGVRGAESHELVPNFRGGLEGGSAGPEDFWLSSHRQVVAFYSPCSVPLEDHRCLHLALGDFVISFSTFSSCPQLLSKLSILMLNGTPNPFCKSCVVVGASPVLGWRKRPPGPFPQSGDVTSWG